MGSEIQQRGGGGGRGHCGEKGLLVLPVDKQMMLGAHSRKRSKSGLQGPSSPNFWSSCYRLDTLHRDKGKENGEMSFKTCPKSRTWSGMGVEGGGCSSRTENDYRGEPFTVTGSAGKPPG